jgi:hypothetical protein
VDQNWGAALTKLSSLTFSSPFNRRRALIGVAGAAFVLLGAYLQPGFEPADLPQTNFDPGWVSCNTIAYGWPLGVLRFAADANCPPGLLPDVEPIWFLVDACIAVLVLTGAGLIGGGPRAALRVFAPRRFSR